MHACSWSSAGCDKLSLRWKRYKSNSAYMVSPMARFPGILCLLGLSLVLSLQPISLNAWECRGIFNQAAPRWEGKHRPCRLVSSSLKQSMSPSAYVSCPILSLSCLFQLSITSLSTFFLIFSGIKSGPKIRDLNSLWRVRWACECSLSCKAVLYGDAYLWCCRWLVKTCSFCENEIFLRGEYLEVSNNTYRRNLKKKEIKVM